MQGIKKKLSSRHLGFRKLMNNLHIHTAVIEKTPVLVFQDIELIGSGAIDAFKEITVDDGVKEEIVFIGGERYLKRNCTLVYAPQEHVRG